MRPALVPCERQDPTGQVLLVLEDRFLRKLLRRQIEDLGLSVREAVSLERALARLEAEPPQLILLDLSLDHGRGVELLEALRSRGTTRLVPVLVLGREARPDLAVRAFLLGAVAAVPAHKTAGIAPWIEAALPAQDTEFPTRGSKDS